MDDSLLVLVRLHEDLQKLRIAQGNRVAAAKRNNQDGVAKLHAKWFDSLSDMEKDVEKRYRMFLTDQPGWKWMQQVKGVGPNLGAAILAEVNFETADTVSALWRYAGLGVIDGKSERPVKGTKLSYNKKLKRTMHLFAVQQIKNKGPYASYYYEAKARYEKDRDWTPMHRHFAALRIVAKAFLEHLWVVARTDLGLPTDKGPWISEYGGRVATRVDPWTMTKGNQNREGSQ